MYFVGVVFDVLFDFVDDSGSDVFDLSDKGERPLVVGIELDDEELFVFGN